MTTPSRWEYHTAIKLGYFTHDELNKYGEVGWELISLILIPDSNGRYYTHYQAVFKHRV
jgi:hypothetical protein